MVPGGAAALSGEIKVGCQLHAVDGRSVSESSTADTTRMILGAPGSPVTLLISDPPMMRAVSLLRNTDATGTRADTGVGLMFAKPANTSGPFAITG